MLQLSLSFFQYAGLWYWAPWQGLVQRTREIIRSGHLELERPEVLWEVGLLGPLTEVSGIVVEVLELLWS